MSSYPPPYPPPGPPPGEDWRYQRRVLRDQARAQRDMARAQRDAYKARYRALRRSSIVGPLLMIAVGVIFLLIQTGHLSAPNFWMWYGRWWPLLLVSLGVVLLIEWVFDRNAQTEDGNLPIRHGIGGGVVLLLILLVLAGLGSAGYSRFGRGSMPGFFGPGNIDQFFGDKHESDQALNQAFPANANLTINNPHGDVTISGTSDDNQIHIAVHKQVFANSDSDADSRANQLSPQIKTSGDTFNVSVPAQEGAIADLNITLPARAPVTVTANHGDVRISSIKAAVIVTANHGDVELSAITGPVTARTNNSSASFSAHNITGSVTLEGHARDLTLADIDGPVSLSGDFFGDTHLEHIRGAVKFHTSRTDFQLARLDGELDVNAGHISAGEAQGPMTLNTRSRNITLQRISGDLAVSNSNGSVDLTSAAPLGNVTVENRRGSVNLTVPSKSAFTVQAQTTDGNIENDFSLPTQENNNHKNFNGTVGKGGSLIRINTSEGDISLKKADLAPHAPPAPSAPPAPPIPPSPSDPNAVVDITGNDGSSIYVGKDGVRIISSKDGSKILIGKNGLIIHEGTNGHNSYRDKTGTSLTENPDGSKIYRNVNGTSLTLNADGSILYSGVDGTRYTQNTDGSKSYQGPDGSRFTINTNGTLSGAGPDGRPITRDKAHDRLQRADEKIRDTKEKIKELEQQRTQELGKGR